MKRNQVIDNAIQHFEELTPWKIHIEEEYLSFGTRHDVVMEFSNLKAKKKIKLYAEIKNEVKNNDVAQFLAYKNEYINFLILAQYISKNNRETLRQNHINYIESSGNCYIEKDGIYIFIDSQKSAEQRKSNNSKLFTESGMRFVYAYFLNPEIINSTYREIASEAEIALGNVGAVMESLKREGYLQNRNNKRSVVNVEELFDLWANNFDTTIRPHLFQRALNFTDKNTRSNWRMLDLDDAAWGGEPAANLLDHYLVPEKFVLYSSLSMQELMKKYKLIPNDLNGEILWMLPPFKKSRPIDPFIIYAELIRSKDSRCLEAAKRIKEKHIDPKLKNI